MLFSKDEIYSRIEKFQRFLQEKSIDLAMIHHNADMFYFSGTVGNGYLIVPAVGNPVFAVRRGIERIRSLSPISDIVLFKKSDELKEIVLNAGVTTPVTLGLAMDVITSSELTFLTTRVCNNITTKDVSTAIRMQRARKSDSELSIMKKAAEIGDYVFSEAKNYIRPGLKEWNLYAHLEHKARLKGSLGIVRVEILILKLFLVMYCQDLKEQNHLMEMPLREEWAQAQPLPRVQATELFRKAK